MDTLAYTIIRRGLTKLRNLPPWIQEVPMAIGLLAREGYEICLRSLDEVCPSWPEVISGRPWRARRGAAEPGMILRIN